MEERISIKPENPEVPSRDAFVLELQRLLACYQLADENDRKIVWSALNKYVRQII